MSSTTLSNDLLLSSLTEAKKNILAELDKVFDTAACQLTAAPSSKPSTPVSPQNTRPSSPVGPFKRSNSKQFVARESLLSQMLVLKDFQTVYNIFVALLLLLGINVSISNYMEKGKIVDFSLLYFAFDKMEVVVWAWVVLFFASCVGFVFYSNIFRNVAANKRSSVKKNQPANISNNGNSLNHSNIMNYSIYACHQIFMCYFAAYTALVYKLPPASGMIVLCEQIRMSMKLHSFFVYKLKEEMEPSSSFKTFIYFFFAPTLIYKPNYPKTAAVNWTKCFVNFSEVFFCILYTYVIFEHLCFPLIKGAFSSFNDLICTSFKLVLPASIVFVIAFYAILHSWLNAFAELTRFADRQFYEDWWNSNSFAEYYRKWNGVVHDFLYKYVYLEFLALFESKLKNAKHARWWAALLVFEISAIVHEYAIACSLGFFYPVLLIMFGGPGGF